MTRLAALPRTAPPGARLWIALVTIYLVWGSTYLGMAIAIESLPPFMMVAIRFAAAGTILMIWARLREGPTHGWPTRRQWRDSIIVGALLLGVGNGFVAFSELTVPTGIAALLVALMPVFLVVLGWVFFRDRLPALAGIGILVGFAGVVLLVAPTGPIAARFDPVGMGALVLAPLGWATGSLFSARRAQLPRGPMTATAAQMLAGSVALFIEGALMGELGRVDLTAISDRSMIALVYLTVIGSLVGFTTFGWLLRNAPLPIVGTYAYVNPVVAMLLGAVVLNETVSPRTMIAAAIIVVGVALVITARGRLARVNRARA